jgi:hypothetical protein
MPLFVKKEGLSVLAAGINIKILRQLLIAM